MGRAPTVCRSHWEWGGDQGRSVCVCVQGMCVHECVCVWVQAVCVRYVCVCVCVVCVHTCVCEVCVCEVRVCVHMCVCVRYVCTCVWDIYVCVCVCEGCVWGTCVYVCVCELCVCMCVRWVCMHVCIWGVCDMCKGCVCVWGVCVWGVCLWGGCRHPAELCSNTMHGLLQIWGWGGKATSFPGGNHFLRGGWGRLRSVYSEPGSLEVFHVLTPHRPRGQGPPLSPISRREAEGSDQGPSTGGSCHQDPRLLVKTEVASLAREDAAGPFLIPSWDLSWVACREQLWANTKDLFSPRETSRQFCNMVSLYTEGDTAHPRLGSGLILSRFYCSVMNKLLTMIFVNFTPN